MNWNHCTTSAKLGAWAEPLLGPVAAEPRDPREAMPVKMRAAPAMPTVARVTAVELVDLPLLIAEVRQETVWLSGPISSRVAEPYNYTVRGGYDRESTSGIVKAMEGIWLAYWSGTVM